ncbi:MAG: hypothetical protein A3B70_03710 [Deltaproteobacteria bacterium RIFCSPHIGHO2_02_FULL_40_11]|nr:MAG: hypothetical protein A3B70_03710 [Deltaproteobacteria bacterium RIFCSPHIGHO2_02_FULL_40_11]
MRGLRLILSNKGPFFLAHAKRYLFSGTRSNFPARNLPLGTRALALLEPCPLALRDGLQIDTAWHVLTRAAFYFLIFSVCALMNFPAQAVEDIVKEPLKNAGLMLIEKEMLRLSDAPKKAWSEAEKTKYRALLFLEDYFLNRGVSSWTMRVMHRLIKMRDNTDDLKKKAFLECEAWRILDHDLKNNEKKELLQKLKEKRKYSHQDHVLFRKITSDKVSACIDYIDSKWVWTGPEYKDHLYDVKTQNAISATQSLIKLKRAGLKPASE